MIRLAMAGACGRMGQTILKLAVQDRAFRVVGALERPGHPLLGKDVGEVLGTKRLGVPIVSEATRALRSADVLIDFTHATAVKGHLRSAVKAKTAYVVGTTGLPAALERALKTAAGRIPVVQSPNMSVGVNLLFRLAGLTARILDEDYDIEMTETHHRHKKDAPSGTAMKLLEVVSRARGRKVPRDALFGRRGMTGERKRGKIGVLALRGGDVVGDHQVSFLGDGERIELIHRASSREAFASGALKAAKFISKKKKGLYAMAHVLGFS